MKQLCRLKYLEQPVLSTSKNRYALKRPAVLEEQPGPGNGWVPASPQRLAWTDFLRPPYGLAYIFVPYDRKKLQFCIIFRLAAKSQYGFKLPETIDILSLSGPGTPIA